MKVLAFWVFVMSAVLLQSGVAQPPQRITILYDAFGKPSALERDWGFAALVEYGGRRVLFDTGNHAGVFERNVKALRVDLARLDAVVISHRHGDHTTGLDSLLKVNPRVPIWTPREGAFFRSVPPREFLAPSPDLPAHLRYYGGQPPERWVTGTPWSNAHFRHVTTTVEILPGFHAITTRSEQPGTVEMHEVSLAVRTPKGLAVIVGCSHPGVGHILEKAARIDARLHLVTGGFHLVQTRREQIEQLAATLDDRLKVAHVAPGHCTGELGFSVLLDRFKERFLAAGVGAVIPLP